MRHTHPIVLLAVTLAAVLCPQGLCQEEGLVAHWPLDEGAGAIVRDASGNGNDGQIRGATWLKLGDGHVLLFDGEDDYVNCGSGPALDLRGPMTLTAWIWPEEVPRREVGLAGKHFTSYLLTYYRDRRAWWYIGDGGNHVREHVSPGAWTHVAGSFDGKSLRFHLNGRLAAEGPSRFDATPPGKRFLIGCVIGDPSADDPNYARSGFFNGMIADVRLYSRALMADEIAAQFAAADTGRFEPVLAECPRLDAGETISKDGITVLVGKSGGMQISTPDSFCLAESSFSYPGERRGQNPLSETADPGEPGWEPVVEGAGADALRIRARGAHYALTRLVRLRNGRVEIEDTLTNPTDEPVGIIVRHQLITPSSFAHTRLGTGSDNPIAFVAHPGADLGLVAEDDVSRAQFAPFCRANRAGFRLNHFALDAGKSHTLRWAVYPLEPTGDALGFVNRVRRDWNANHTILGPASFFDAHSDIINDPARLKAYLQRRNLGVAMLSPWLDYDPGSMDRVMPRDEYKAMMQRAAAALRAADPDIKCLGSIETDWVTIYPDQIEGGDRLPVDGPGGHGPTAIGRDLAQVILDSALPWKDSMKRDQDGGAILELYSRGGKPQTALGVFPAPGNHQARFLMDQARFIVEEVGLDGFYIDEFSLFWVDSHDKWDGTSVNIDRATGQIIHRYTSASVAGVQPRRELCEYAVSRGLVMVANTFATTAWENACPIMRFAETWSSFDVRTLPKTGEPPFMSDLAKGQLGTPIGLGVLRPQGQIASAELLMRGIILYLRHGMVYYHYFYGDIPSEGEGSGEYGPINHMFPITPVRLFEGGIEGEERTITCVSGTYAWRRAERPAVLTFGPDGRQKPTQCAVERADGGWSVGLRLADWTEIGVIEAAP